MTSIIFQLHFGLKNIKSLNCKTKAEWTWLFCSTSVLSLVQLPFLCLFLWSSLFVTKAAIITDAFFFPQGIRRLNHQTRVVESIRNTTQSNFTIMKESDPCSCFGQSGLRFMLLLAKANRFLKRVTISNLRNGVSLNILSGLLSVVKVWNLNNDFRYNAVLSKGIYHISVIICCTCAPRVPMIHWCSFYCFVVSF